MAEIVRVKCPECGRTLSLDSNGHIRKHGPVGFACRASGWYPERADLIVTVEAPVPAPPRSPLPWRWTGTQWAAVSGACREADRRGNVGAENLLPSRLMRP